MSTCRTRKLTQESKQVLGERINKEPLQCHTCGKAGHIARDCRMKSIGGQKKSEKDDKELSCGVSTVVEGDTCP